MFEARQLAKAETSDASQSHLIQALKRLKEIAGDGVALKLLLKRVLNYLHPFGQPHARFLVGLECAMHVVNFDADIKGGLDEIHGKSNLWTRLTRCEKASEGLRDW
jgi:hypothetical protein